MTSYKERIYVHDERIIPHLASELPHSCTVLRCIQHGTAYPSPTATILATFPPGATPEHPWMVAYVDLFRGRETQMVVYSSLEAECTSIVPIDSAGPGEEASENLNAAILVANPEILAQVRAQLLSLLSYTKTHLRPTYLSSSEGKSALAESNAPQESKNGVTLIPAPDPRAFLIGSLHTGLYALLQQSGTFTGKDPIPGVQVHRIDYPPYNKFIFPRSAFRPGKQDNDENTTADPQLPPGYRYHDRQGRIGVLPSQFDLVQSRTHIPRSKKQLSSMPGVAIYFDDPSAEPEKTTGAEDDVDEAPIAWAFIGKDGALATLHVEPEHRGRGLALRLAIEVMRIGMAPGGTFGGGENEAEQNGQGTSRVGDWVHTEVAQYNQASRRVMEKIGGQVMTTVVWTVIELCD